MALTEVAIRNARPGIKPDGSSTDKTYALIDTGGLLLEVSPCGGKWWRFRYTFEGKRKRLSLGVYPAVTLKQARERRDETRTQVAQGIDPGIARKAARLSDHQQADSFEVIAREWYQRNTGSWVPSHGERILRRLERDVFPYLGARSITTITTPDLLKVLRRIEERGAIETAHRALQNCGQIYRYAVATGRAPRDPTGDLKGALPPARPDHLAAIIDPPEVGKLLWMIDDYRGFAAVRAALRLMPLVFVRPGELRNAEWDEFDLDKAEWNIPPSRMKMREPHLVPLSRQALVILHELHPVTGGGQGPGRYLFPGARSAQRPISDNAINAALRSMGYDGDTMTGHGFRAMARTLLDEVLGVRPDYIEHQLAHAVRDPLGRAYNRTKHLAERREMMQKWADYLDTLKAEAIGISRSGGNRILG